MKSFKKHFKDKSLNIIHASIHGKAEHFDINEAITSPEEIKSNSETSRRLTKHYSALLTNKYHKEHIREYTRNSSPLNSYHWDKHKNEVGIHKDYEQNTKNLDNALHSYKSPEDLTVWSSTIHNPEKLKNKEGIVHHPAYLSTSILQHVALDRDINSTDDSEGNRHHHILKIHVPKESHGAYVYHISKIPGEHEFLLPRGSNLKHLHTEVIKEPFHNYLKEGKRTKYTYLHSMELQP